MYTDHLLYTINIFKLLIASSTKKTIFNMTHFNTEQHRNYRSLTGQDVFTKQMKRKADTLVAVFISLKFPLKN